MPKKPYYRRPDGLYETSRTVNGKRVVFRGRTCREVDRKILEYQEKKTKGRTFPEVAKEWYDIKEKEVCDGTMANYNVHVNRAIEAFPSYIKDITARDVRNFILRFEHQGFVAGYVRMQKSVLTQIFSYAVIAGDLEYSPAAEVKVSRNLHSGERRALTVEEEKAVSAYRGENWLLGMMLLYTGCRRGELFALNWQDIDREAGVIHINKKISYSPNAYGVLEHHLKSKNSKRDIPLLEPLAAVLPRNRIGVIFAGSNSTGHMTAYEIRLMWKQYIKSVGLDGVTMHCFRHSFATICYEAGIDSKTAAAFLGDTEAVTQNVYQELRKHHQIRGVDLLNAYIAEKHSQEA
jgi:integrase